MGPADSRLLGAAREVPERAQASDRATPPPARRTIPTIPYRDSVASTYLDACARSRDCTVYRRWIGRRRVVSTP